MVSDDNTPPLLTIRAEMADTLMPSYAAAAAAGYAGHGQPLLMPLTPPQPHTPLPQYLYGYCMSQLITASLR